MRIMLEDGLEEVGCFEGEEFNFHPVSQHLAQCPKVSHV